VAIGINLTQMMIHAPALKMMMMMMKMTGFGLALRISTSVLMYVWKQVALTALTICVMIWVGRALEKMESYMNMTFNHC
jgi:hypothetical protein